MASSSSSLSFINEWKYDVFISFRGIDTRSGFTGSLHRALRGKEIKSFMDDQDLEKGAEINPALDEAIQNSRIALVILSKNYASSTFCLDELMKIMDCSKNKGMFVLPVFYEVEPSDVRYQKGKYADALNKHEARITEKETIQKWRLALNKIANLSGWSFNHDKYEYELIDIIIQDINKKIHSLRDGEKDRIICNLNDKDITQHDKKESLVTEFLSPENEARHRVAATKIQHAFRNFKRRKIMEAIQYPSDEGDDWWTSPHPFDEGGDWWTSPHPFDEGDDWWIFPHQENAEISRTSLRAKVYLLNDDGKLEEQDTGHVSVDYLERSEEMGLFIHGDEDNEPILLHTITSDDIYRKQEDRIISWRDPEYAIDLALSFQKPSGCSYIWDHICGVQRNMQFNTFNRVKSVEINSKQQEVTVTGYVEPNKVLKKANSTGKKAEIWPYVPYNLVAQPYATGTVAISYENSYIHMFSDNNPNACSIM